MPVLSYKKSDIDRAQGSKSTSLSLSNFFTYSAPMVTLSWLGAPIHILQGIYAKYYGFSLVTLASVILFARLFDAVSDPLIGYFSDRYQRRRGTRKAFILVGGLLLVVSSYFLNVPVNQDVLGTPSHVSVAYFTCWFIAFYLAMTLFEIPHGAWASELALSSVDKSKIFSFRNVAGMVGMVCFYSIPLLPIFDTRDITPETLKVSVVAGGALMLPLLYLCLKHTPNGPSGNVNGVADLAVVVRAKSVKTTHRWVLLRSVIRNKPLLIFFSAFLAYGFAMGMWYSLIFFYVDGYLGLGEQFAQMFLLGFLVGIVATPGLCKLSINFGKKAVLAFAMLLLIASFIYASALVPGEAGFKELIILQIINVLGAVCMMTFAPAMLSEIVDYSAWKYRIDYTATYYAMFMFLAKFNVAVGGAIGLAIAGWYGFDATTTAQTTLGIRGLLIGLAGVPTFFIVIGFVLIVLSPINTRRHSIIRQRLDGRLSDA